MRWDRQIAISALCVFALAAASCSNSDSGARKTQSDQTSESAKNLNVYIWSDYLAPDTIESFEKSTGVKVHVSHFENNETLEAKMLTGNSGFDVVFPTAPFLQRQLRSGAYIALDKKAAKSGEY